MPAANPDLRIGEVEVHHIFSIDLAELVKDGDKDRRILQHRRAADLLFDDFKSALLGRVDDCVIESERIRVRMRESLQLGGKAVWTDHFLDRFAPIRLPTSQVFLHNEAEISSGQRLSNDPRSQLHFLKFQSSAVKLFRDGTITYTVRTTFDEAVSGTRGTPVSQPATISQAIERLEGVDRLLGENFHKAISALIRPESLRSAIREKVRSAGNESGLELMDASNVSADDLKRKSKEHRVIFVESFFDGQRAQELIDQGLSDLEPARVDLQEVLASSSLAGLLNTASWYDHYDRRYVQALQDKEIGYRDDEIYITDRKATVVSAKGFWREDNSNGRRADPLSRYRWDVVLAVEYNVARLAYSASTLSYYQNHPDVHGLEIKAPLTALPQVIDGRSIVSHIEESLDLSLLVNHGFTRVFIRRLREELGIDLAIEFIRHRVEDASTSVGLKSSVLAAENTSKESLKAAVENNQMQRTLRKWAVVAVALSVTMFIANIVVDFMKPDPPVRVCVLPSAQPGAVYDCPIRP